jgi:hypothetical protein
LKTTETSYSGDESGDNSECSADGEEIEKPTQETTELLTVDPTEEDEVILHFLYYFTI